jgi:hypothetical protein
VDRTGGQTGVFPGARSTRDGEASRRPRSNTVALFATSAIVKIAILLVATVVFLAVYSYLLDRLERRGP